MKHPETLREYCRLLLAAPVSVTSVTDPEDAWALHVLDALSALELVTASAPRSMIDVGSGGGSPGIPLAVETGIATTLLESRERKAQFLRDTVATLGLTCDVATARSEDLARGAGRDAFDVALARALAPPPVALELCLPLIRPGGRLVLWSGHVGAATLAPVAQQLGGRIGEVRAVSAGRRLIVVEKAEPTPERFPRRPGVAAKRPLA